MKRITMLSFAMLFLLISTQSILAQMAPQEFSYGEQGTKEIGLSGSIILPTELTIDGETDDDGTTTITMQPFFKYFFRDRIHAGAQLLIQNTTTEVDDGDDQVTNVTVFSPHIGYTFPLSPRFQLDAQANLGFTTIEFSSQDINETAISGGLSFMALSPLSESAVIGIGIILNWTTITVDDVDVDIFTKVIPIQVSFYF
jgi:hypothetical protein